MSRHTRVSSFGRAATPLSVALWLVAGCGSGGDSNGNQPLVIPDVSDVAVGDPACPSGGVRVRVGVDDNRDGDLDDDEVDSTSYVCNGGDEVLTRNVNLQPGAECAAGGRRIDIGLDNGDGGGTAGNGVLEDGEVDTSYLDCNGEMTIVVAPPAGPVGTFVLDTHGGSSEIGGGGGDILMEGSQEVYDASFMIASTGTVDASCSVPTLQIQLGAVGRTVSTNTTVSVVNMEDEAALANGTLFMRSGDGSLYVRDTTAAQAPRVTGLRVAEGATLTLAINNAYNTGETALQFPYDVEVLGTVTTLSAAGRKGDLTINARQVHLSTASSVDTAGASGEGSGGVTIGAYFDMVALGSIDTHGSDGTAGSSAGYVNLTSESALYVGGTITTQGGAGTAGSGGRGGDVNLEAGSRLLCNAADITTDGGAAAGAAGDGGDIRFGDICLYNGSVEIRNSGDLRTRGGVEAGTCSDLCDAGDGGSITFIPVFGGGISNNASLDTRGGESEDGQGGQGGHVELTPSQFVQSPIRVVAQYQVTGEITTFGGDGLTRGGRGGDVRAQNFGALGSSVRFLGYASAILDSGDGSEYTNYGGNIRYEPEMRTTEGGLGLYLYTDISSEGGDGGQTGSGVGGSISFSPEIDEIEDMTAPVENFVVVGDVDLNGGSGRLAGPGGTINTGSGCSPQLGVTGIRIAGDINLNAGDASNTGGYSGSLYLNTARGSVTVTGTISADGGDNTGGTGGYFAGTRVVGTSVNFSADFTAAGGTGSTNGGNASDIIIISTGGGASTVTGTISLTAGAGPTASTGGTVGLVRVDTGAVCDI